MIFFTLFGPISKHFVLSAEQRRSYFNLVRDNVGSSAELFNRLCPVEEWKEETFKQENCLVLLFCFRKVIYLSKVNETISDRLEMIKNRFHIEGSLR